MGTVVTIAHLARQGGGLARLAVLLAVASFGCRLGAAPPERIVLVTIDTLRADHVGCYGYARAHTPTLDRLAAEGVRYEVALSPVPLTLPSHTTIMTGLDPDRHGVRHNSVFSLDPGVPTLAERLRARGYATAAFIGAFVLDRRFGLARGFDLYDDQLGGRRSSLVGFAERRAGEVTDSFERWLATAPPRFFVWLHYYDAHASYDPPEGFKLSFPYDLYSGEIAYVDAQLGRALEALSARFDPAGTLVLVTSDHGESLGEHGELSHSYGVYEATQRVPLVARGPGFTGGRVAHELARLADVTPTLLAEAGAEPISGASGRDLRGRGSGEPAYHETLATHLDFGWAALFALRGDRWKYIRAPRPELYDLAADPKELANVAADHPDVVRELAAALDARLSQARPLAMRDALSSDDRARLEALGYVVPAPARVGSDLSGPDPKDRIGALAALERADRLADAGHFADAYAALNAVEDAGPALEASRAAYALNAGLAADAERHAREALRAEPDRPEYRLILAASLETQGRYGAAADAFRAAADADAKAPAPWNGLGRVREATGDPRGAADAYEHALSCRPGDAEATWRLAAIRIAAGDVAGGRALLAAAPDPPAVDPALRAGAALLAAGDPDAAATELERALGSGSVPLALASPTAAVLEAGGHLEAAQRVREAALRQSPDDWQRKNEVAWGLALLGRERDRALALARDAVEQSEGAVAALDTLATVQLLRAEMDQVLRTTDGALARAGSLERPHLLYLRARALSASGRRSEARAALAQALAAAPAPGERWRQDARELRVELASNAPPG